MALTFHFEDRKPSPNFIKCSLHKDKNGCYYLDMDGFYVYIPQCFSYAQVVELLIVLQESFKNGFTLVDCTNE